MPRRDGTGPDGKGPRTGRGLGNCVDSKGRSPGPPDVGRPYDGRGRGQGRRPRRRRGRP